MFNGILKHETAALIHKTRLAINSQHISRANRSHITSLVQNASLYKSRQTRSRIAGISEQSKQLFELLAVLHTLYIV